MTPRRRLAVLLHCVLVVAGCAGTSPVSGVAATVERPPPLARLWVSPLGDDAATGTVDRPLRTITRAGEVARAGTEVVVEPGSYPGSVATEVSGTRENRVVFRSSQRWGARVVGSDPAVAAWRNDGDFVDVIGFDVQGAGADGVVDQGSDVMLRGNRVRDFRAGNCIATSGTGYQLHDIDVVGNVVSGCGSDALHHGIYVSHPGGTVADNLVLDNSGYGIHCWHNCNRLVIANNTVVGNHEGGIVIGQGDGPNYGAVAADGFLVSNNILAANGGSGITESGATGQRNRYLANLVWDNAAGAVDVSGVEVGTIRADPQFVDPARTDMAGYGLRPGSPAVDAGTPEGAPPVDLDGTSRPRGAAPDIGALESH